VNSICEKEVCGQGEVQLGPVFYGKPGVVGEKSERRGPSTEKTPKGSLDSDETVEEELPVGIDQRESPEFLGGGKGRDTSQIHQWCQREAFLL